MFTHYRRALESCQPYLLATQEISPLLEMAPLGIDLQEKGLILDPQARKNEVFLHLLQQLDRLNFGTLGMAMPKWVFYDCGVMPSAVFGFCGPAASLEPWVRRALKVPADYDGPVPLSIFIAIPMLENGSWFTHTLCTLNQACTGAAPEGLVMLSLALGVRILKIQTLYGATQWRNPRLGSFVSIGPLQLLTAYTPSHSVVRTLTWKLRLRRFLVEAALISPSTSSDAPPATHMLDVDDVTALIALQRDLEAGIPYAIVGRPTIRGSIVQVPLHRGALEQ
ncbi:MAG: hypothetical protein VX223_01725 [Myxococcota bacterium]|nr:hypothetical protein [Myxococcota bacterium]